jgi:hypothetical protein
MRTMVRTVMVMALLASAAIVHASEPVKVTVPFDFVVQGHVLPAGAYTIRNTNIYDPSAVQFDGGHGGKIANTFAGPLEFRQVGEKLVFENDGGNRILKSLVTPSGTFSFANVAVKSAKRERAVSAAGAGN